MTDCSLGLSAEQVGLYAILVKSYRYTNEAGVEPQPENTADGLLCTVPDLVPHLAPLGRTIGEILVSGTAHMPGCEPCSSTYEAAGESELRGELKAIGRALRTTGPGKAGIEAKL